MKRKQLAAILRSVDRFAGGEVAIGALLLTMKSLSRLFVVEPWRGQFGAAFTELEDRYSRAVAQGNPLPTAADGNIARVLDQVGETVRSYSNALER